MADMRAIYQRYTDNLLWGATVTATVDVMSSYELSKVISAYPSVRIRWSTGTVTLEFTLGSSARADLVAIPFSNADAGSSVLTLENDAGLSEPITIEPKSPMGWPRTSWLDLTTAEPNASKRTSNKWRYVFTGNSVPLTLGGGLWLSGTQRRLFVAPGSDLTPTRSKIVHANDYQTDLEYDLQTETRPFSGTVIASTASELQDLEDWIESSCVASRPGLFIRNVTQNRASFGPVVLNGNIHHLAGDTHQVPFTIRPLSKGKPI